MLGFGSLTGSGVLRVQGLHASVCKVWGSMPYPKPEARNANGAVPKVSR